MSDVIQAFVSQGGKLLGHEFFTEPRISVGSGDEADLFLDEDGIEEIHAWVERKGKRVVLTVQGDARVKVGGEEVRTARLRGFDDVVIGPISLKFKVVKAGAGAEAPVETPPPDTLGAAAADEVTMPAPDSGLDQDRAPEPDVQLTEIAEPDEQTAALMSPETSTDPSLAAVSFPAEAVDWQPEPMTDEFWELLDDGYEEDLEDEPVVFSLADKLVEEQDDEAAVEAAGSAGMAVQATRLFDDAVAQDVLVRAGGEVRGRNGGLVVGWPADGKPATADGETLQPFEAVEVTVDGDRWRVRLAPMPKPIRGAGGPPLSKNAVAVTFASVAFHVVVIGGAAILLPTEEMAETLDIDRFAQVQIIDPALEQEKKEEEEKEEALEPEEIATDDPQPVKETKVVKKKKKQKSKFAGGGGVLGALSRFSERKGGKTSIAAMVAGITGVKGAQGAKGFSVSQLGSGIGGKLVAGGTAGGPGMQTGTRGKEILAGLNRKMGGRKKSKVRGTVRKASNRQIRSKGSGSLDKAAIASVVGKNIGQVRYCYERTLLKSPNLRGKVVVQWTIAPTGKVRSASTQFSSVTSDDLTRCILGKIKSWKFPKPTGGQVIVSYPFIFNSVGF